MSSQDLSNHLITLCERMIAFMEKQGFVTMPEIYKQQLKELVGE